jgi:threonine/homoserine/homoserine lactone efflux protein
MEALVGFLAGLVTSVPMLGPVVLMLIGDGLAGRSGPEADTSESSRGPDVRGGRAWLAFALAAALSEGVHVALAVFGVAPALLAQPEIRVWARVAAGVLLVVMGVLAWRAQATSTRLLPERAGPAAVLGAALVLPNPGFLVAWVATAAFLAERGWLGGVGPGADGWMAGVAFVVGAVLGVMVWFVAVRGLAVRVGARVEGRVRGVRKTLAVALIGCGAWLVGTGLLWSTGPLS